MRAPILQNQSVRAPVPGALGLGGLSIYPDSSGRNNPTGFAMGTDSYHAAMLRNQQQQNPLTIIGNGPGSPGYDERINGFMNGDIYSAGGGGGGGGMGSLTGGNLPGQQPPNGMNLNPSNPGSYSTPSQINPGNSVYPNAPPINYQSPQNQNPGQGGIFPGGVPQGGALQMQQQSPQNALNNYYNSPGYQVTSQDRFQHSPGYQYSVDEALGQVQRNASSRGLLESGSVMREMTDRAQNMAQQDYGNWRNREYQQFGDYQNRLAGLAGGSTGSEQAYNLGNSLGQGSMQMGSNLGSLFGSQGNAGFAGMYNTGAAQAGNIMGAGNTQAQINAANQSTRLAGQVSNQIGSLF